MAKAAHVSKPAAKKAHVKKGPFFFSLPIFSNSFSLQAAHKKIAKKAAKTHTPHKAATPQKVEAKPEVHENAAKSPAKHVAKKAKVAKKAAAKPRVHKAKKAAPKRHVAKKAGAKKVGAKRHATKKAAKK